MTVSAAATRSSLSGQLIAGTAFATLGGLAAGGAWALASVFSQRRLDWLAVVVALILAGAGRRRDALSPAMAAGLALLACGMAMALRLGLQAAMVLSQALGLELPDILRRAGPSLIWQVARLPLDQAATLYYAAALGIAAVTAWRRPA